MPIQIKVTCDRCKKDIDEFYIFVETKGKTRIYYSMLQDACQDCMPFKSKSQIAKLAILEKKGKLPKWTVKKWAKETPNMNKLPKRLKKK